MNLKSLFLSGAVLAIAALATPAHATLSIDINTHVPRSGPNGGNVTVATLTIQEIAPDVIKFTLVNSVGNLSNHISHTFISKMLFSYDGSPSIAAGNFVRTNFTATDGSGGFTVNPPGLDGGYDFFVLLDLPDTNTDGGVRRFKDGETLEWTLSKAGIDESDFDGVVGGSGPDALALVYIESLTEGSAQFVQYVGVASPTPPPPPTEVPEPASLALFGAALSGLVLLRRRLA